MTFIIALVFSSTMYTRWLTVCVGDMASGERAERYALRVNLTDLTEAVEFNLEVIAQRLEQEAFITSHQRRSITDTTGLSFASKASRLLNCVLTKVNSDTGEKWFERFVHIIANCTTENELVKKLIRDFSKSHKFTE